MGAAYSSHADVLVVSALPSVGCSPSELSPNLPPRLQGLITQEEWSITVTEINKFYAAQQRMILHWMAFFPLFVLFAILTAVVSPFATFGLFAVIFVSYFFLFRRQTTLRNLALSTQIQLNQDIFGGALLHLQRFRRQRHRLSEVAIDLNRLRQFKADSLESGGATAQAPHHTVIDSSYPQQPSVSPFYNQSTATLTDQYEYAMAEAVAVDTTPVFKAVPAPEPVQQQPTLVQIMIPSNAVPGSMLNATLSDGRVIAITVPPNVKPGQTVQVEVPAV